MREWLTVIIVLLILGILLDGMRRMRAHRRENLRMKHRVVAKADQDAPELVEPGTSEFPSGGARVAAYRDPDHALSVNKTVKENRTSRWKRGATGGIPEQVSLNLDAPVPMLMDSVDDTLSERSGNIPLHPDRPLQSDRPLHSDNGVEPSLGNFSDLDDDDFTPPAGFGGDEQRHESYSSIERTAPAAERTASAAERTTSTVERSASAPDAPPRRREAEKPASADSRAPDEVLIVNVMARKGELFSGPELLEAMLGQGLRYGDMDIFHRHESADGRGRILFSAANIVVPGTLDLTAMEDFTTPGISLFLSLPIASDSLSAYNLMVATAQAIADALQGELKDEQRSVMTRQTIEHGRQRVIEYERKRRLAKS
jgi:cell division protein ZipA